MQITQFPPRWTRPKDLDHTDPVENMFQGSPSRCGFAWNPACPKLEKGNTGVLMTSVFRMWALLSSLALYHTLCWWFVMLANCNTGVILYMCLWAYVGFGTCSTAVAFAKLVGVVPHPGCSSCWLQLETQVLLCICVVYEPVWGSVLVVPPPLLIFFWNQKKYGLQSSRLCSGWHRHAYAPGHCSWLPQR